MPNEHAEDKSGFYSFSELVDPVTLSQLLDNFYQATGIPNGLVGPKGEKIFQAGWSDACSLYHRVNPDSERQCIESNLELLQKLQEGKITSRKCKNGLYDFATPVVIEGQHLVTLFLGQVFNSPPDIEFFSSQAKQFNYSQDKYLDAIRAVPVISREQMDAHTHAMASVIQILAASGLSKLRESQLKQDLSKSTERRIQTEDLLRLSPVGVGWSNAEGNIEYINQRFTELFGYTLNDLPNLETWYSKAYPDIGYRNMFIEPWRQRVYKAEQLGTSPPKLQAFVTCKDGSERQVLVQVSWVGGKRLVTFTDISEQWRAEQRSRTHNAMLEMVAKAESLPIILATLAQSVEEESPSSICSVHLLDEKKKHLLTVAAPSLPQFYNEATDKLEIGDGVGSCGTAVVRRERVIVEDISTHEYWQNFSHLAQQAGLAACWSEPILSSTGTALGTFAIYHREPAVPNLEEIERISFAANLAAIAIENENTRNELTQRELQFRTLADNAPVNIARYDRDGRRLYVNPRFAASFPGKQEHLLGTQFTEQTELPYRNAFHSAINQTVESGEETSFEVEFASADGEVYTHLINMVPERDERDTIKGVLATGLDITERKQLEERLTAREREFRTLAENIPINISRFDKEGYLTYANSRLAADFPLTIDKVFGTQLSEEPTQPYTEIVNNSIIRTLEDGVERSFEIEIPVTGGGFVTHLITMVAERDESGSIIGVLATAKNVSERKRLQRELERQARLDFLTGLLNRRYFMELAKMELLRLKRHGGKLSLIMFDIDHFKVINDSHGHSTGDLVLKKIANISHETVREIDVVGRLGGEEFVVLLPQTDKEQAVNIAGRLRHTIAEAKVKTETGDEICFTASFGVATFENQSDELEKKSTIDDLLIKADTAMYQAKQNGRNQVHK